jgi:hypothetical protein
MLNEMKFQSFVNEENETVEAQTEKMNESLEDK